MAIPSSESTYGNPPYSETSFKAILRRAAAAGLQNLGAGLGAVPRGANFGTAFLASMGGSSAAYSKSQEAAQEYALKQKSATDEADFRDYKKAHMTAQTKALEKPPPPQKKDIHSMTEEEWRAYLARVAEESKAKSAGRPVKTGGRGGPAPNPARVPDRVHKRIELIGMADPSNPDHMARLQAIVQNPGSFAEKRAAEDKIARFLHSQSR